MLKLAANFARSGAWGGTAGMGRVALIDSRDVAAVFAVILTDGPQRHAGKIYDISGPTAVTMDEVAAYLSAALGTQRPPRDSACWREDGSARPPSPSRARVGRAAQRESGVGKSPLVRCHGFVADQTWVVQRFAAQVARETERGDDETGHPRHPCATVSGEAGDPWCEE
jgi:hypothetical protein